MSKRSVILYDREMRTAMEECRVMTLRRKREIRWAAALSLLCFLQVLTLMMMAGTLADGGQGNVPQPYGLALLSEDASGYVLVGVIAFMAAVAITVLCSRYRRRKNM